MRFVDTNIPLYAVSNEPEEAAKRLIARELLAREDLALSAQVMQEFYVQATRPNGQWRLTHEEATRFINSLLPRCVVQDITADLVLDAFALRARFGLNYWDCAILATARLLGCDAVYSEDMSDTQDYDGLRVITPSPICRNQRNSHPALDFSHQRHSTVSSRAILRPYLLTQEGANTKWSPRLNPRPSSASTIPYIP